MMSSFDKNDEKAFTNILGQMLRLQVDMQNYLSMRQKSKEEDSPELQKKIQASLKALAGSVVDDNKAEENFQKLHQMKDNSIKCSSLLFSKEHVKAVLKEVSAHKQVGNMEAIACSMSLLMSDSASDCWSGQCSLEFAGFFSALLEGTENHLLELIKESDESIKEGVVQIADKQSAVDQTLEQLCLEGNRQQAKHAVSAIAAISTDSGSKVLSELYGRLLHLLATGGYTGPHLPTILQSLGCIAENAMPVFETREDRVVKFIVKEVFKREKVQEEGWKPDWENPSEECLLKIYGLKVLIKSFLPIKEAEVRRSKLKGLLGLVFKLLTTGEVLDEIKSSDVDKANIRLAAGKAILRLSRRWDPGVPPKVVQATLLLAHDPFIQVRQKFLMKVHQYTKERWLPQKYACVFALVAVDPSKEIVSDGERFLAEFVETCRREARSRQVSLSGQTEGTSITYHPEYVLTYLIHVLAHEAQFGEDTATDISQYESVYRQLLSYLRALVHPDRYSRSDLGKKEDDVDKLPAILAIFRSVKNARDLVDEEKTETLYTLCDIGILITKDPSETKHYSGEYPGSVPLPSSLYKVILASEGEEGPQGRRTKRRRKGVKEGTNRPRHSTEGPPQPKVDGSHLPACFTDKDILARFRNSIGASRTGQAASPRGQKRERRSFDEESSDEEGEKHEDADVPAKSKSIVLQDK